jgi:rubrerythrin
MRTGLAIAAAAALAAAGAAAALGAAQYPQGHPPPQQQRQAGRPAEVRRDLDAAMKGEAFAYAKYMLYAEQARAHGHPDIAALFERTAQTERMEHFREHARLAGLLERPDADNLRDAIEGEAYETRTMYPDMAERARRDGDGQVAARFSEVGKDELKHRDAFAAALMKLERTAPRGAGGTGDMTI